MSIFSNNPQTTNTTNQPLPWMQPYMQDYMSRVMGVANQGYTASPSRYTGPNNYMQDAWRNVTQTAQGGATVNPYANSTNPQLTRQIRSAQGDLADSWNNVQKPAWETAMANSGSYGNTGVMQATGNAQQGLSRAMGEIGTNMRSNAYNQAANLSENFAGRNDAFNQWGANAQMGIGNQMQGFNQQQANQNYNWWQEANNFPRQQLDMYGRAISSMNGGSQTTTTQPGPSTAGQILGGALTGWNLYNMFDGGA